MNMNKSIYSCNIYGHINPRFTAILKHMQWCARDFSQVVLALVTHRYKFGCELSFSDRPETEKACSADTSCSNAQEMTISRRTNQSIAPELFSTPRDA